jgi:hypothetical protein
LLANIKIREQARSYTYKAGMLRNLRVIVLGLAGVAEDVGNILLGLR